MLNKRMKKGEEGKQEELDEEGENSVSRRSACDKILIRNPEKTISNKKALSEPCLWLIYWNVREYAVEYHLRKHERRFHFKFFGRNRTILFVTWTNIV